MSAQEMGTPVPREAITTIPRDETSGLNILYTTLKDIGYDLAIEEQPDNPSLLRVTSDPDTKRKIEKIREDINWRDGSLHQSVHAILEPWDGLIDEVSRALDDPTRVSRFLGEPAVHGGGSAPYSYLAELFVLAYQKGRFAEPDSDAAYGQIPLNDKSSAAIRSRLSYTQNALEGIGVKPITLENTQALLRIVIEDYLKPRPMLQPLPSTGAEPQQ